MRGSQTKTNADGGDWRLDTEHWTGLNWTLTGTGTGTGTEQDRTMTGP